ncbi:MAG: DUF3494 domain-containing protein [Bacteroidales bacterium]|nr:DUF3494 domain-containing protein [Bacteroidales bacterium]
MKRIIVIILVAGILLSSGIAKAQVGIGIATPDPSSLLDLYSTEKGLLIPRLTTEQRDLINNPATGLLIYNLSASDVQMNTGTPVLPAWIGMKNQAGSSILSVTASEDLSTSSTISELIPGMTLSPEAGTYLVLFNGQYGPGESVLITTEQRVIDLEAAYNEIMAIPATDSKHAAVFGNGETLYAGVYDVGAAASLAGTLILDGGGDSSSVFIIRTGGALNSGAGTIVNLTNGAKARNIFWVAEGAIGLGASTVMKGTLLSHDLAVSAATGVNLEGRMFTTAGAVSFGPGTAYIPSGSSYIDLGVLSSFIMFTSVGAVSNTEPSDITGDVGSNSGAITGFESLNGNIYYPGSSPPEVNTLVTFSIYQNGALVANSSRTSDMNTSVITLQAIATVTTGQAIDIRWKVDEGPVTMGNRILTLIDVN